MFLAISIVRPAFGLNAYLFQLYRMFAAFLIYRNNNIYDIRIDEGADGRDNFGQQKKAMYNGFIQYKLNGAKSQ